LSTGTSPSFSGHCNIARHSELKSLFGDYDKFSRNGFPPSKLFSERLVKFNIPSTERVKVLKFLDAFNLNAYSLFGSEESLMETIAIREFDFGPS